MIDPRTLRKGGFTSTPGVKPERLMAIHVAVAALIEVDRGSHRIKEFHRVQTTKAVHRLASGTHPHWEWPMPDGTMRPLNFHAYPKSSGIVLRVIGSETDEICGGVAESAIEAVRAARLAKSVLTPLICRDGNRFG